MFSMYSDVQERQTLGMYISRPRRPSQLARAVKLFSLAVTPLLACAATGARAGITFQPPAIYPVGLAPNYVTTGDVNNDGLPDIVVTANSGNSISVLLNNPVARGKFLPKVDTPLGASNKGPNSATIADFDGDGWKDIAVGCWGSNTVVFLKNLRANGAFAVMGSVTLPGRPMAVTAAALRRGALPDVVVACYSTNDVTVLRNNGNFQFSAASTVPGGQYPRSIVAADLDNDGNVDIATANYSTTDVTILYGKGDGTLGNMASIKMPSSPYGLAVGKLNADGLTDLAATDYQNGGVFLIRNNGFRSFSAPLRIAGGESTEGVAFGDFNKDGHADVATANYLGKSADLFMNNGDGTVEPTSAYSSSNNTMYQSIAADDFNGDGLSDIVLVNSSSDVTVLLNTSVFVSALTVNPSSLPAGSAAIGSASLSGFAPDGGALLTLSTDGDPSNPVISVPPTVTVPAGQSTVTFDVVTRRQGAAWLTLDYNGQPKTVYVTVGPPATGGGGIKGDLDGDGKVTMNDAVLVLKMAAGEPSIGS